MRRGLLLLFVLLLHTSSARADPIPLRITDGSLDFNAEGAGLFDIVGARELRLTEFVETATAFGFQCRPCAPGDAVELGGTFAEDFGSATLAGVTYTIPADGGVGSRFSVAQGVAPALGTSGILSVPFTYHGSFTISDPSVHPREFALLGQGMATIQFQPDHGVSSLWDFGGAHFDFRMAPTPEPATLLLLSSGLVGVLWRRRAHRRAAA